MAARVLVFAKKSVAGLASAQLVAGSMHLAATIAEVLAFFVAERGDGVVLFYGREFAAPDDRGKTLLTLRG